MVEVHHKPDEALSDGPQSLFPDQFDELMDASAPDRGGGGKNRACDWSEGTSSSE